MTRFTHLETFTCVVEEGSFSAAARRLGLTKSTTSTHVAALEHELGVRLLNRTTRQVTVTEVGARFYNRCMTLLANADEALREASHYGNSPVGTLRVSAPLAFGHHYVSPLIPEFLTLYPGIDIVIHCSDSLDLIGDRIDVGFWLGPIDNQSFKASRIARSQHILCASPQYLASNGTPSTPQELEQHYCLILNWVPWVLTGPQGRIKIQPRRRAESNYVQPLHELLHAGMGISYPPLFCVASDIQAGRLQPIMTEWCQQEILLSLVFPPGNMRDAKTQIFADFVQNRLRKLISSELPGSGLSKHTGYTELSPANTVRVVG